MSKKHRTTKEEILQSTDDSYMFCPNCGSMHMYRDIRDSINSCHGCGFTHFVGLQTVQEAIEKWDKAVERNSDNSEANNSDD